MLAYKYTITMKSLGNRFSGCNRPWDCVAGKISCIMCIRPSSDFTCLGSQDATWRSNNRTFIKQQCWSHPWGDSSSRNKAPAAPVIEWNSNHRCSPIETWSSDRWDPQQDWFLMQRKPRVMWTLLWWCGLEALWLRETRSRQRKWNPEDRLGSEQAWQIASSVKAQLSRHVHFKHIKAYYQILSSYHWLLNDIDGY